MDDRIVIPITDQNYLELIRELENLLDQMHIPDQQPHLSPPTTAYKQKVGTALKLYPQLFFFSNF